MKKIFLLLAITSTVIFAGCGEKPKTTYSVVDDFDRISVNGIEVEEIEMEQIEVEQIEVEHIIIG